MVAAVTVEGAKQCYEKCQTMPINDCVAFAYSPADSRECDLYRGGPYTYGSGDFGSTCYIRPTGKFHLNWCSYT